MLKNKLIVLCGFITLCCAGDADVDVKSLADELLQTDIAFARMSVDAGAAEAFHYYLDDNALQLLQGRQPRSGKLMIYELMKPGQDDYVLDWQPVDAGVAKSGDMGFTWGTWTVAVRSGSTATSFGKYLNVWKRQPDGQWRVLVDMGNENPEPGLSK